MQKLGYAQSAIKRFIHSLNVIFWCVDSESDVFCTDDEEDEESTNTYSSVSSYPFSFESFSLDEESVKVVETKYVASLKNASDKNPLPKGLPKMDNVEESTSLSSISI